jgi:hypothetical protein
MTEIKSLIERIHATAPKAMIAVAGAGSEAITWLLRVPGASRTILETRVPYGRRSMICWLGREPEQFVSSQTARDMAKAAYRRGLRLVEDDSPVVGVACTAAIATDRARRGDHRGYIATWDQNQWLQYGLVLTKGTRDRSGEEAVLSRLLLLALAHSFGIEADLELGLIGMEHPQHSATAHPPPVQRLISGDVGHLVVYPDGRIIPEEPLDAKPLDAKTSDADGSGKNSLRVIFPGSFSPLHQGHQTLAGVVANMLGAAVFYEISVTNVDKPPLEETEVLGRVGQFRGNGKVLLTRAETFYQKARLFPNSTFVVGWDTAMRLVDPRYYGGSETNMLTSLAEMWAWGSRFLVAGREHQGRFMGLADVPIPPGFYPIFQGIPESSFRVDLSSTQLRAQG